MSNLNSSQNIEQEFRDILNNKWEPNSSHFYRRPDQKYFTDAKLIWRNIVKSLDSLQQSSTYSISLGKGQSYPLDPLIFASYFISYPEALLVSEIYTLFYIIVHLLDDLAEDKPKLIKMYAKSATGVDPSTIDLASHESMLKLIILLEERASELCLPTIKVYKTLDQIFNFLCTNLDSEITFNNVLLNKYEKVTAPIMELLYDLLPTGTNIEIKSALHSLGYISQLLDDLRDTNEDLTNSNPSVMLSTDFTEEKYIQCLTEHYNKTCKVLTPLLGEVGSQICISSVFAHLDKSLKQ